jgi:hypothetical protein
MLKFGFGPLCVWASSCIPWEHRNQYNKAETNPIFFVINIIRIPSQIHPTISILSIQRYGNAYTCDAYYISRCMTRILVGNIGRIHEPSKLLLDV